MKYLKYFIFFLVSLLPFEAISSSKNPETSPIGYISEESDDDATTLKFRLITQTKRANDALERLEILRKALAEDTAKSKQLSTALSALKKSLQEQSSTTQKLKKQLAEQSATNQELEIALKSLAITAAEAINKTDTISTVKDFITRHKDIQLIVYQAQEAIFLLEETLQHKNHGHRELTRNFAILSAYIDRTRWCCNPSAEEILRRAGIANPETPIATPTSVIISQTTKRVALADYATRGNILRQSFAQSSYHPILYGGKPVPGLGSIIRSTTQTNSAAGVSAPQLQ